MSAPVREDEVQGAQLGQTIGTILVVDVEVGLAPVHRVPHVVHDHGVVPHFRPGQPGEIRLPVAFVPRRDEKPPDEHRDEERPLEQPSEAARPEHAPNVYESH